MEKYSRHEPPEHDLWDGYAELSLFLGYEDEYRRVRRQLLDRFAESTDPQIAERTGRACLLLPASDDELRKAVNLIDLALAADKSKYGWAQPYFMFAKGLAEYRQGRMQSSLAIMEGTDPEPLKPAPSSFWPWPNIVLAKKCALKTLAAAVLSFDWRPDRADIRDVWICHLLRREAEDLILSNLSEFLQGKYQPRQQ